MMRYYANKEAKKSSGEMTSRARLAAAIAFSLAWSQPALAQMTVRVGQPQAGTFQFVPLQVANEVGIFKRHGIDVDVISFGGGPRVQQALAAESIDIGIGSGPELAFVAKGAPEIAIAAIADAPYSVVLAVARDSLIKAADDLKGKTVSISSKGSLTDWLGRELSRQLGWGSTGINLAPLGSTAAQMAALKTRQIDGMIVEANAGYRMEEDGSGRVLVRFGDRIKVFHIYIVYARSGFLRKSPDAVRAFLAGWFESVAFMREHRAETIDIVRRTAEVSPGVATRDYDELMGMFNRTGRFERNALDVLARSFVEMGLLPRTPDMRTLITEQYLPRPK
jgi:ABC-type nitrate/sulfonate/bicarbonate transport system substrate-binding protein